MLAPRKQALKIGDAGWVGLSSHSQKSISSADLQILPAAAPIVTHRAWPHSDLIFSIRRNISLGGTCERLIPELSSANASPLYAKPEVGLRNNCPWKVVWRAATWVASSAVSETFLWSIFIGLRKAWRCRLRPFFRTTEPCPVSGHSVAPPVPSLCSELSFVVLSAKSGVPIGRRSPVAAKFQIP